MYINKRDKDGVVRARSLRRRDGEEKKNTRGEHVTTCPRAAAMRVRRRIVSYSRRRSRDRSLS